MKMTWRWYGEGNDQIKLSDIKQIPSVEGIVWALHDKMPGEVCMVCLTGPWASCICWVSGICWTN